VLTSPFHEREAQMNNIRSVSWAFALLLFTTQLAAQGLGTLTFPTSGAAPAQSAFLTGVKALHNFQFDEAAVAFREAQKLDPAFALAYWGEAMSYNHPLWNEQNIEAAGKVLERLAPTHQARLAKAKLPKEKALLEAMQQLYFAEGEKHARDIAYSAAMASMYEKWPEDHEIAILYSLSLLGATRPGDSGFKRQALAAAIAQRVYQENPQHPGAAHFIIHAFDDPDHAPLALPAARAYAKIAPASAHALHMPSHIFVQLGMWPEVVASNTVAHKAAVDLIARLKLPEGREDFHTLSWLQYGNLMLGKFDEAKQNLELAREAMERNAGNQNIRDSYYRMRARQILESAQWESIPLDEAPAASGSAGHHAMPGMPGMSGGYGDNSSWIFVAGVSATKLGNLATAEKAAGQLRAERERVQSKDGERDARYLAIQEKELAALVQLAQGRKDQALVLAKEAADIELTMPTPSGPPSPIKPAFELYGEVLLEAGQAKEAAAAFEQSLLRTPNRTPSVMGAKRAAAKFQ
jgi:tetratricopeptide (TPR) repeat protein